MLTFPVAREGLKVVAGRRGQKAQFRRRVKLQQLSQGDALEGVESLAMVVSEESLRITRTKAADHLSMV